MKKLILLSLLSFAANAREFGDIGYGQPGAALLSPQQNYEAQQYQQREYEARQSYENQQQRQQIEQQQYQLNQQQQRSNFYNGGSRY